jgi:hypothetical protein
MRRDDHGHSSTQARDEIPDDQLLRRHLACGRPITIGLSDVCRQLGISERRS